MSPRLIASFALILSACGGGGGGGQNPPPPPAVTDVTPPDTSLSATPAVLSTSTSGTFTTASTEAGSTFQVSLDSGAYTAVAATFTLNNLSEGPHTVNVRALDAAGNIDATPATFAWSVDSQAPDTTLTTTTPANTNSTTATFSFSSEAGAVFQTSVDGGAYAAAASPVQLAALANGAHTFAVRARDAAGNVDATPATFAWQVDTTQPSAQILFPSPFSYTDANQLHVRGTTSSNHTITAVTVNGVAASTTDAFAHWSALVPTAAAVNNLVVSVTDNFGNTNVSAASANVANRGVAMHDLRSIAWDAAHDRVLAADRETQAIVALRGSDGRATILSDATHGTGPPLGDFFVITVDAANNRAISMTRGTDELLAVDLTNGNRSVIPTDAATTDTSYLYGIACNSPCTRIYSFGLSVDPSVFSIDLATGVRTVISGGQFHLGSGRSLSVPTDIALDTSTGTPRLLISDSNLGVIHAVNLANGDRTIMSSGNSSVGLVGAGVAFARPNGFAIDAANNRLLVSESVSGAPNRVMAVNLANGDRTLLPIAGTSRNYVSTFAPVLDAANSRLFIAAYPRANVIQVNLNTNQLSRFADANIGDGPILAGGSILLDASTSPRSLLTTASGAVVRVDLVTGTRSVVGETRFPNNGPAFFPNYLQFDTRPGVPANRVFFTNGQSNPATLYSLDTTSGVSTALSTAPIAYSPHGEHPLDAANGRLLINSDSGGISRILPIDVATGAIGAAIADSSSGAPPFGSLNATVLENAPGLPQRIIAVDNSPVMYAIETATGNRAIVSGSGVGAGPPLVYADALAINTATRRALALSGTSHALQEVDLLTGNRTTVSGGNRIDTSIRGTGPWITPLWGRIAADFPAQLAYVTSNSESIVTVDLVSGDRVLTAR